jgi:hypothetical protein
MSEASVANQDPGSVADGLTSRHRGPVSYGYRLADAGPHPYPSEAADGWRLRRLEPDPITAPVVSRTYRGFLAGSGIHAIAERVTRDGILPPSTTGPVATRSVSACAKSAVRVILTNPATHRITTPAASTCARTTWSR